MFAAIYKSVTASISVIAEMAAPSANGWEWGTIVVDFIASTPIG